jgi:hypothetical protein
MMCLTCQFKLGQSNPMTLGSDGTFFCRVCGTTKRATMAAPVMLIRSGVSRVLYVGGIMLLLLANVLFDAFPVIEMPLTWTMLYSLYLVYFGLAFVQLRRKAYG